MILDRCGKVVLEYPCPWVYKLIGPDVARLHAAVAEIGQERACTVTPSSSSRTGKYHCLDVEIVVAGETERNELYLAFKGHPAVIMVL